MEIKYIYIHLLYIIHRFQLKPFCSVSNIPVWTKNMGNELVLESRKHKPSLRIRNAEFPEGIHVYL